MPRWPADRKPAAAKPPAKAPPRKAPVRRKPTGVKQNTDRELDKQLVDSLPAPVDPGYDGHMLRIAGKPWAEIAKTIGSPSAGSAMRTVSKYLRECARNQSSEHMQEALQTQIDRYEVILAAWWEKATKGQDEGAATVVLRAMERLDRVLRLTDGEATVSKETIVVSPDPAAYVKQLQEVVADRDERNGRPR